MALLDGRTALIEIQDKLKMIDEYERRISELEQSRAELVEQLSRFESENRLLKSQLAYYRSLSNFYASQLEAMKSKLENVSVQKFTFYEGNITGFGVYATLDPEVGRVVLKGAPLTISLKLIAGDGKVLVNTEPITGADFQSAARAAVEAAKNLLDESLLGYDMIFSIKAPFEIHEVDGPSAGALMSILLIGIVEGKALNPYVSMTGTISPDGSIGPVGGIVEKARAAAEAGFKVFLIPEGQGTQVIYEEKVYRKGPFEIVFREPKLINVSEYMWDEYGIRVVEVDNLKDAYEFFKS